MQIINSNIDSWHEIPVESLNNIVLTIASDAGMNLGIYSITLKIKFTN
jgi:hypothetical protein